MTFTYPHKHVYIKPEAENDQIDTLILLHGTGGTENDLIPIAQRIAPGSGILGIRGNVSENGMARYFRRLSEGVFDLEDLQKRAVELSTFIREAAEAYDINLKKTCAVGYSNGANIATAVHFLDPGVLRLSIHFRPMVPFVPPGPVDLTGTRVLLSFGTFDPLMPRGEEERLSNLFQGFGSGVTVHTEQTGHQLVGGDLEKAAEWLIGL